MVKEFKLVLPAADLGNESPMPDIKNVSYIHAGFKTTNRVSRGEKKHLGKGMIQTILPYKMQNGYNRVKKPREFNAISVENDHIRAVFSTRSNTSKPRKSAFRPKRKNRRFTPARLPLFSQPGD